MHFHLPKPLHGWREFAGEVGIVFLGVAIALAGEQLLEARHWSKKLDEVRSNMVTEMRDDDAVIASAILSRTRCADQVLDQMAAAIDARSDRRRIASISSTYPIIQGTFESQAFSVAQSSEALLHGAQDDLVRWGGPYGYLPVLNQALQREWDSVAVLQSWSGRPGQLSEGEERDALHAIGSARAANGLARKGAASLLTMLNERLGLRPPRADQISLYRKYRADLGSCAIDAGNVDLTSLRSSVVKLINHHAR